MKEQQLSVLVVDSRSKEHPDWLDTCVDSIRNQTNQDIECVLLDNRERLFTAGRMYNQGMQAAVGKWVAIVNEDDFIEPTWCEVIEEMTKNVPEDCVCVSTYSTFFDDKTGVEEKRKASPLGAYRREYILEHPFNEHLNKLVDVTTIEAFKKDGKKMLVDPRCYGYHYRSHATQISGKKSIGKAENFDIIFIAKQHNFIEPYIKQLEEDGVKVGRFSILPDIIKDSVGVVWCDWGDEQAVKLSKMNIKAKKILRVHSYEAYSHFVDEMNWDSWDRIVFVAEHTRRYLERRLGYQLVDSVVIKNGVDFDAFTLNENKKKNNKIAFVGNLKDGKGVQLLIQVAREFPGYEFHIKGQVFNRDIEEWLETQDNKNIFLYKPGNDVNEFLQDKTYIINTSIRESCGLSILEGMACGCKPLIYNWIGANELYPGYVWKDFSDLIELLDNEISPKKYREQTMEENDFIVQYKKIKSLIGDLQ